MNIDATNVINDFFEHRIGIAVASREEYELLLDLLIKLYPKITWVSGSNLHKYNGFIVNKENTFLSYNGGVRHGDVTETKLPVIGSEQFKDIVENGKRCITFEEILFGDIEEIVEI